MRDEHRRFRRRGDAALKDTARVHDDILWRARGERVDLLADRHIGCAERAGDVGVLRPHDKVIVVAPAGDDYEEDGRERFCRRYSPIFFYEPIEPHAANRGEDECWREGEN